MCARPNDRCQWIPPGNCELAECTRQATTLALSPIMRAKTTREPGQPTLLHCGHYITASHGGKVVLAKRSSRGVCFNLGANGWRPRSPLKRAGAPGVGPAGPSTPQRRTPLRSGRGVLQPAPTRASVPAGGRPAGGPKGRLESPHPVTAGCPEAETHPLSRLNLTSGAQVLHLMTGFQASCCSGTASLITLHVPLDHEAASI
jgi:hypothetical protein